MTRSGDVATPTVTPHVLPPSSPLAAWRHVPTVALEYLPAPAYTWDSVDTDVTWDDITPERVWDAPFIAGGFTDAVCDFHAIDIDPGDPDDLYLFPPVSATVTLDNRTGAYTPWSADGRLVYWAPGRRMCLFTTEAAGTPGTPAVPAHLDPAVGTVSVPYTAGTGVTVTADPPAAATYWRQVGANAEIGRNPAGAAYPGPIRSLQVTQTAPSGADVLVEPFNNLTAWTPTGTPTIVTGRTGTAVSTVGATARIDYLIAAGNRADTITVGFAWKMSAATGSAVRLLGLWGDSNGTEHNRLIWDGSGGVFTVTRGSTSLWSSATGLITINAWQYFEIQIKLHDTAGTLTVKLNGSTIIGPLTSLDTKNAGTATVYDTIRIGGLISGTTTLTDDLYVTTGAGAPFKGPITIPPAVPTPPDTGFRFDAAEYPGTGTSFVDPRGETWTLSAPGAIVPYVPAVPPSGGERLWLFSGRVASWTVNPDDTVTVVAYDGLSWLAQELGGDRTYGTAGDSVAARLAAVVTAAAYPDRVDVDPGTVTLATVTDARAPIEHVQRVALSDGGLFYGDADGSLDYRNRLWRAGRDDQPYLWSVSDNVCEVPVVVWNAELAADDERLATDVRLINTAGLVAQAALGAGSPWAGDARYRLSHPDPDLWTTQGQGDTLAGYLLAQQSTPSMALNRFELYPLDPQQPDVWEMAVRTRRGDRVNVVHDFTDPAGQPGRLDLYAVVLGVAHNITPEGWVSTLALSRTVDWHTAERWDTTAYTWDDPNPLNVWRY